VSFIARARYSVAGVVTARRWRRRLALFACHPHLAPVAWACGLVSGAPYAVWCHGVESWGGMSAVVARGLRAADLVFAPSEFTARRVEEVARLRPGSVRVVPHGVVHSAAGTESPTQKEHPPVVLCVARLVRENRYKGIDTLLYAWPRVLEKMEATLLIVGDGPDASRLRRIADALDLNSSVRFAGPISDGQLAAAYASSSVFAMPGRHRLWPRPEGEGFGLVYVEAGAAGLPVIAGDRGGSVEAVEEGGSGLLLDARDHRAVADAIVRLLTDPVLARRLGERGRELADGRFSYETFRASVADLVDEMAPRGLL
jgi:phosphatidyl-myo-inositol dimannoside synthase